MAAIAGTDDAHAFQFSRLQRLTRSAILRYPWFAVQLASIVALAPLWMIETLLYGPPRKSWSLAIALRVRSLRWISAVLASTGLPEGRRLSEDPSPSSLRRTTFLRVPAIDMNRLGKGFVSEMAALGNVTSTSVPTFVYSHNREALKDIGDRQIMLFAHGGAYVVGDASEHHTGSAICLGLLEHTDVAAVVSVDYRLSTQAPFPAAMLDALSVYAALIEQHGLRPDQIVFGGDSAGGHLALSLARLLRERQQLLPSPRGLVLFSPGWLDIRPEHDGEGSLRSNYRSDILPRGLGGYARSLFCKGLPLKVLHSPYVCPNAGGSYAGFPRTVIISGEAECLRDDIRLLATKMEGDGVDVTLHEYADAFHDFCTWSWSPDRVPALQQVGKWLKNLEGR